MSAKAKKGTTPNQAHDTRPTHGGAVGNGAMAGLVSCAMKGCGALSLPRLNRGGGRVRCRTRSLHVRPDDAVPLLRDNLLGPDRLFPGREQRFGVGPRGGGVGA